MLAPVDKSSLSVEVANNIRLGILSGRIQPGQKLLEQELSEQLNTSRGPIRDAFIRLEQEGLVLREPNRSVKVVIMTEEDIEEIHSLRLSMEQLALRYICSGRSKPDVSRLRTIVDKLRTSITEGAVLEQAVEMDLEFHEEIVRASGHRRLHKLWLSLKPQIGFLIYTKNIHNVYNFAGGSDQHEELIEAIEKMEIAKCEKIIREHLNSVLNTLLESYRAKPGA